ncbi:MAG: 4Fe-4S dicluster domain-containing protein [Clostridia bacterium]|nr:4Fe-4S dicluster domain-containing protein [Clostridia bacterium]
MDNSELKIIAKELGFAEAYLLPPPDLARVESEPSIIWNTEEHPWAKVSCLLVMPYSPYPADCRIPAYYIASNRSYRASVELAKRLEAAGARCLRAELPIKQLAVRYRAASPCRSSLISIPPYGTRVVFQSMLLGSSPEHPFSPEEYSVAEDDMCASCRACEAACPAHAISGDGYDVKKCMRYYMDGADYPDWVYGIQRTHLGCEICQQVCPRNAHIKPTEPPEEVVRAFDVESLAAGDTKPARLLVGKNITGRGKLQKEALNFLKRDGGVR